MSISTITRFGHGAAAAAAVLLLAMGGGVSAAAGCTATSGARTVPLVELFTSEGCDSCPAADRWLTEQFPAARNGAAVTVLAFHVDYWDRLGWKDRFASPQYTQRQHDAMRANKATFVYTRQVLVQGRDARWQRGVAGLLDAARERDARAVVTVDASPLAVAGGGYAVRATAVIAAQPLRAHAALWLAYADSGLVSDVTAGENRGVRLAHDHVVRSLSGPYPVDANGRVAVDTTLGRPAETGRAPLLVAIVQNLRTGDVLQTLTLPACGVP
jgi:hypothetical protein